MKARERHSLFNYQHRKIDYENNIKENNKVLITVGSRKVEGFYSKGTGFLIKGTAKFIFTGKR